MSETDLRLHDKYRVRFGPFRLSNTEDLSTATPRLVVIGGPFSHGECQAAKGGVIQSTGTRLLLLIPPLTGIITPLGIIQVPFRRASGSESVILYENMGGSIKNKRSEP